jgi:prophage antirepressor-like protein
MVGEKTYFDSIDLCNTLGSKTCVDPHDKIHLKSLLCQVKGGKNIPIDGNDGTINYINESDLYPLAFGSKQAFARLFKRWVTSDVLLAIRNTGSHSNDYPYWRNDPQFGNDYKERCRMVQQHATGREDELHYKVVTHLRKTYCHCMELIGGIGEHLQTNHAQLDAYSKRYRSGQPDIKLFGVRLMDSKVLLPLR